MYIKSNASIFKVTTNPTTPISIDVGGSIDLHISFDPISLGNYSDSLLVEIVDPCDFTTGCLLTGTCRETTNKISIWIPDTLAKIGDQNFCIPLYAAKETNKLVNSKLNYEATISFEPSVLLPVDVQSEVVANQRIVHLSDNDLTFSTDTIKIGEFCSQVFIGEQDKTPLIISNFELKDKHFETEIRDGSITVTGICQSSIARLTLLNRVDFYISANPVSDILKINLINNHEDSKIFNIDIFDVFGQRIQKPKETYPNKDEIKIDVSNLTSGVYFVRVGDRVNKFIKI